MNSSLSDVSIPKIWCDFNACGWSGAPGDNCYYAFDQEALATLHLTEGMRLFIYDDDGVGGVVGCEARLESFNASWRIRPDHPPRRPTARP